MLVQLCRVVICLYGSCWFSCVVLLSVGVVLVLLRSVVICRGRVGSAA